MGLFEQFPYSNFHEMNLDWVLHELKKLETQISNFVAINSVKYANPIIWDITNQYETNTVVLDNSGNAYLSVQPVPAGVSLDREEYWTKIGNFSALWDSVRSAITPYDEQHNTTASVDHKAGDWVWVENDLLLITKNMTAGDKYVDGGNCKKTNVHDLFTTLGNTLTNEINTLSGELQDEITARENGDKTLNANIAAEATARETADTALEQKITDAVASIEGNRNIVSLQEFGVTGSGDESAKVQQAFAWAKAHGIGKIVSKTDVQFSGIVIDFSVDIDFYGHTAQGVRIHEQTNRIKTMFTASTVGLNIRFRNMTLKGFSDLVDAGVKPGQSSPIEISNANSVVFDGCTFANINGRWLSEISDRFNQRKGVIYTILDVADTVFTNCVFNNCNGEELGFILPVAQPREYLNASIENCIFNKPINTSAVDFVGNTFVSKDNIFNYDYSGSYLNAFALHLIACGDTVSGNSTGDVYDNCEELLYNGYTVDISNVNITGNVKTLCNLAAQVCYVHDIADTSKITNGIMNLRPGTGSDNSQNFIYASTTKLADPIGIIENVNAGEGSKQVFFCAKYAGDARTVYYNGVVRNCVWKQGRHITAFGCKNIEFINCEIDNYIDSTFGGTPVGIYFAEGAPDNIRLENCIFHNINKANQELTVGGVLNKNVVVVGCVSDSTHEKGNRITSESAIIGQAGNIKILQE